MKIRAIYVVILLLFSVFNSIALGSCYDKNYETPLCNLKTTLGNPTYDSFDWRDAFIDEETGFGIPGNGQGYNWVSGVRDQGTCGSCYAFGSIAAIESIVKIKLNRPDLDVDLSEQFIVSCGWAWNRTYFDGCSGANLTASYKFIEKYGSIPECFLEYVSSGDYVGDCEKKYSDWKDFTVDIKNWVFLEPNIEIIKNALIKYGPLSASLDLGGNDNFDHRIAIVGYDDSQSCWICKNSYGIGWGNDGGYFTVNYGENRIEDKAVYFELENVESKLIDFDLDFTMHRIKQIDEIDPFHHKDADWGYRISVYNNLNLEHEINDHYFDENNDTADDDHIEDVTHTFHLHSFTTTPTIIVKVWDDDEYIFLVDDDDLADISSNGDGENNDGGEDDDIHDKREAMLHFRYNVITNEIIEIDNVDESNDGLYYTSKGDSTNAAKIWFKIDDSYKADLSCDGSLSWSNVELDSSVSGSFIVKNIGDPETLLDWEIESEPSWGDWSFSLNSGDDLTPEDGEVTVYVTCTSPNDFGSFNGNIAVVNKNDDSDVEKIPVFLSTREPIADLSCDGSLSWSRVKFGSSVSGSFTVRNGGEDYSLLDWEIDSYPSWGSWSFSPRSGEDLTPDDSAVTVSVTVTAPGFDINKIGHTFNDTVKVCNIDDADDVENIPASLTTVLFKSKSKCVSKSDFFYLLNLLIQNNFILDIYSKLADSIFLNR